MLAAVDEATRARRETVLADRKEMGDGGEWTLPAGRTAGKAGAQTQAGKDVMVENGRNEGIGRPKVWTDWSTALLVRQNAGNRIGVLCGPMRRGCQIGVHEIQISRV